METYSSKDAQNQFGEVLLKAQHGPVCIKRYNKAAAYVVSASDFEAFLAYQTEQQSEQSAAPQAEASAVDNKQITVGVTQYPGSLHISFGRQMTDAYLQAFIMRPPLRYGSDGQLHGKRYVSLPTLENGDVNIITHDDGQRSMAVTFRIIPEACWGDGSAIVSDDFKLRWEISCHPDLDIRSKSWFQRIERFEQVDDKTFVLHFKGVVNEFSDISPLTPLNARLERPVFESNPVEYQKNSLYRTQPTNPALWNGPFCLETVVSRSEYILVRNRHWFGKQAHYERIRVLAVEDVIALESAVLSGAVDVAGYGMQTIQALAVEELHGHDFKVLFGTSALLMNVRLNLDNPILADVRVRQALLYALNRTQFNQDYFSGKQVIANGHPSEKVIEGVPCYDFDAAKAIQLLEEAGWNSIEQGIRHNQQGEPLRLELVSAIGHKEHELVQQWMQMELRKIGIDLHLQNYTTTLYVNQIMSKRQFPALALNSIGVGADLQYRNLYHSSSVPSAVNSFAGNNLADFSNEKVDRLIEEFDAAMDGDERRHLGVAIQRIVFEELPIIPLFWRPSVNIIPSWLKGFQPNCYGVGNSSRVEEWYRE
ncbi:type II toxin-antitoxin system prevent-host-death family antitoxin [bacterium SCSIO 12696]|nr:type II toxin-antitoxin system prevent-host-death family antitoxin [bacterium SCSIO 12696]